MKPEFILLSLKVMLADQSYGILALQSKDAFIDAFLL